jgi:hypothetical protein
MIALMMKAVSTSETSVNLYETTWCNIPEGCHLHTRRRENLKSHNEIRAEKHYNCCDFIVRLVAHL